MDVEDYNVEKGYKRIEEKTSQLLRSKSKLLKD